VLCELSLCDCLVWMLGYVEFDWSALELNDFELNSKRISVKTTILDSLTIGFPSNLGCSLQPTSSSFNHWDFWTSYWSLSYALCTKAVKYVEAAIRLELAQARKFFPRQVLQVTNTSINIKICIFLPSSPPNPHPAPQTSSSTTHDHRLLAVRPLHGDECFNWSEIFRIHLKDLIENGALNFSFVVSSR